LSENVLIDIPGVDILEQYIL